MTPTPVTPPERDTGQRALSVYDLEKTLVIFIQRIVDAYRFDNPTLNLSQATGVSDQMPQDPDQPPVNFDPTLRAQTLALKVAPRVIRGRVPRTVTGEIDVDKLADVPHILVQMVAAKVENTETIATVRIFTCMYDENPDSQGYQDCQNIMEALAIALTSFGQAGIDKAYVIVMPIEWKLLEADAFPHYIAEMTTHWELPSGRPLPDYPPSFLGVPAEHIDLHVSPPPIVPFTVSDDTEPAPQPPEPPPDVFVLEFSPSQVNPAQNRFQIQNHGLTNDMEIRFAIGNPTNLLPTPLTEGNYYFVVNATTGNFQVATSLGGAAVVLTDSGVGNNDIWKRSTA